MTKAYEEKILPNLDKIIKWAADGVTVKDIAKGINLSYSTFRKYIDAGKKGDERYAALSAPFTQACACADANVQNAVYKRACGYTAIEKKRQEVLTNGKKEILVTEIERHIPADVRAAELWLTNRCPDKWRKAPEVVAVEKSGESGIAMIPAVTESIKGGDDA